MQSDELGADFELGEGIVTLPSYVLVELLTKIPDSLDASKRGAEVEVVLACGHGFHLTCVSAEQGGLLVKVTRILSAAST